MGTVCVLFACAVGRRFAIGLTLFILTFMPVISVTLLPGYPPEAQHRLVQRLAHTARSVIDASDAGTTVFVQEVSAYRRDGRVFSEGGADCQLRQSTAKSG